MKAAFRILLLLALAGSVALIGAIAIWIYPDVSFHRATFAAS